MYHIAGDKAKPPGAKPTNQNGVVLPSSEALPRDRREYKVKAPPCSGTHISSSVHIEVDRPASEVRGFTKRQLPLEVRLVERMVLVCFSVSRT